jgi:hypothetical protein
MHASMHLLALYAYFHLKLTATILTCTIMHERWAMQSTISLSFISGISATNTIDTIDTSIKVFPK